MNLDRDLSDHSIYDLTIMRNGEKTDLQTLMNLKRTHLRIGYDDETGDLFVMTKSDGMIRRIRRAWLESPPSPAPQPTPAS